MITIITGFYILNSKFSVDKYIQWIKYFVDNIRCETVIFTNSKTEPILKRIIDNKKNIKYLF